MPQINPFLLPPDFPNQPFERVQERLAHFNHTAPAVHDHFTGAWNAVRYRYWALSDYGEAFTRSIEQDGGAPPPEARYQQERYLFGFFSSAFSVFEAVFYGLFAAGALLDPKGFPIATPAEQRRVSPSTTIAAYKRSFPGDDILTTFDAVTRDPSFEQLREVRNVLTHRAAPGRTVYVAATVEDTPPSDWKVFNIPLDAGMARARQADVARLLSVTLVAAQEFIDRKLR